MAIFSGARYLLTITNDYTRQIFDYLLWQQDRAQNRAPAKISRRAYSTAGSRAQPSRDRERSRKGETHRVTSPQDDSRFLESLVIKKKQQGIQGPDFPPSGRLRRGEKNH